MFSEEEFARLYPLMRTVELAAIMGLTPRQVRKRAQRRGLRKSPQILSLERSIGRKGTTQSAAARTKLSAALKGRKASAQTRAKLSLVRRQRSAAKQGLTIEEWRPRDQAARMSPAYYSWRNAVYDRDGYRCGDCGYQGNRSAGDVHAHHLLGWATHPEARFDVGNGVTLCPPCHAARHGIVLRPRDPIACACGCGEIVASVRRSGRQRRFINGHWVRTRPMTEELRAKISATKKGKPLSPEHATRSAAHLRALRESGRWNAAEVGAKVSAAKMGHAVSDQTRDKLHAAGVARYRERLARGQAKLNSKLTSAQVRAIREARAHGMTSATLAQQYGVYVGTINRLLRGATWAEVD